MPTKPRISVHEYIDARLDGQDDHIKLKLTMVENKEKLRNQKILIELRETRAWVLMFTAPSWAAFIQGWTSHEVAATISVITFIIGLIGILFYRTRKPLGKEE